MKQTKRRTFWFLLGIGAVALAQVIATGVTQADTPAVTPTVRIAYISEDCQTVWDLARKEFPGEDPRRIVHDIKRLNDGIEFGRVQIGQAIKMPGKEVK